MRKSRLLNCLIWAFLAVPGFAGAQQFPPIAYYSAISNQTGATLKSALHEIIKGQIIIPYDSSSLDTYDVLTVLDLDPTNSANVILIYSGYSVPISTRPDWNREHIWPESYGTSIGAQHSDLSNLRACDAGVNSSRNNKYYDVTTPPPSYYSGAPECSYDTDSWEPRDTDKGFVARACLYMSTRYNGTGGDMNLQLNDSPNAGIQIFSKLSVLLDWNRRFPPTDWERGRNNLIATNYQHNRNPFIDNPDYADMVFLGDDGFAAWQAAHFSTGELSTSIVSASVADPDGDGLPNLAEYTFGHDPHTSDGSVIQSLTMQSVGGTNYLYVTHHRHHYLSGVSLTYQISTNLATWSDVPGEVVGASQIDFVKDSVTVRLPAMSSRQYLRFKLKRLADGPIIIEDQVTLDTEGCSPGNTLLDPDESVTLGFSLKNVGTDNTSNLVVTLLPTGGVSSPSAAQNYGVVTAGGPAVSRSFSFVATGSCGGELIATLHLQDGEADLGNLTFIFVLGQSITPLAEDFDNVIAPALPSNWITSATGAQSNWITAIAIADSLPNAVFSPDPAKIGVNEIVSPSFPIRSQSAQLTFSQNYSFIADSTNSSFGYDGGVLEIAIGGSPFQDILAAGGSFGSGGYNSVLSSGYSNPLGGRQAWSGNSLSFITTTVNLPSAAAGENVQLRWRCAAGASPVAPVNPQTLSSSGTLAFWTFDGSTPSPTIVATNVTIAPVTVNNVGGSLTYFQGNPSTGQAIASRGFTQSAGPLMTNFSHFAFAMTVTNGFQASLSSLSFDDRASSTGPTRFNVQISKQADFSSIIFDSGSVSSHGAFSTTPMNNITLTNANLTGTIYFRVYGYGATDVAGTWRLDNLNLQGDVTPIPTGGGWYIDSVSISDTACCTSP